MARSPGFFGQPMQPGREFGLVCQAKRGEEQRRDDRGIGQAFSLFKPGYLGLAVANGEPEFTLGQPSPVPEDAQHLAEVRHR